MKEDKTVPQLRFPEFTDAWKQRKFGDSFDFLQNNTLSRASLNDTSGCAKNVHYGDILVKFGESISAEKADLPFICEREILKKLSKSILKNGDVVIADTAEDMTTGKSCEIVDVDECMPVLAGLHTIPVRPKQKFGKYYLGYYLNSEAFHSQLIPLIQGIKVYSISKSSIKDTVVMFPDDVQEQEKIGSLFNRIDNTITLQQRKLNSLQKLKKGLLQKMFPKNGENIPEIRFPEFSDAWKQRKLREVVKEFYNGQTPYRQNKAYWGGNVNWLTSGDLNRDVVTNTIEKITEEGQKASRLRIIPKETLVIAIMGLEAAGTRGNCGILGIDTTINQACMALIANESIATKDFLFQWYKAFGNRLALKFTQGTKQQNYNEELLGNLDISYPSLKEQQQIGAFFTQLDNTITLQQRKLESLQKLKKGLLQQMFI